MNLSSDGLIDLAGGGGNGPLCPNSLPPVHPSHAVHTQMIDAAYEATPKDGDGEPATPELAAVNDAISYGPRSNDRMRLYRDLVSVADGRGLPVAVEALFFRCGICGLILPANRVPTQENR